ncbi:hypothetical protein [Microcoleus vaginatus]|uniref:hypothetical protein n=1 Tax=Microcoleus vaginatus TaxID=119532 RepID=UPI00403FAEBC
MKTRIYRCLLYHNAPMALGLFPRFLQMEKTEGRSARECTRLGRTVEYRNSYNNMGRSVTVIRVSRSCDECLDFSDRRKCAIDSHLKYNKDNFFQCDGLSD